MQSIVPILPYSDARGSIRWRCATFGFGGLFSVPGSRQFDRHAPLKLGTGIIVLGTVRPGEAS